MKKNVVAQETIFLLFGIVLFSILMILPSVNAQSNSASEESLQRQVCEGGVRGCIEATGDPSYCEKEWAVCFEGIQIPERFEFDIDISDSFANIPQNGYDPASIPINVIPIRGTPQTVNLWTTDWSYVGIEAWLEPSSVFPASPAAYLNVQPSCATPPDQYLFSVHGDTDGTTFTSVDSVTVTVTPGNCNENSNKFSSSIQRAQDLVNSGNYEEAVNVLYDVLMEDPNNINALLVEADAVAKMGYPEDAILYYDQVIANEPNNVIALSNKASLLLELGRDVEASEIQQKLVSPDSTQCSGSTIIFDSTMYSIDDSMNITVISPDANKRSDLEEEIVVDVISGVSSKILSISETGEDTGVFSTNLEVLNFVSTDNLSNRPQYLNVRYFNPCENEFYEEETTIISTDNVEDETIEDENGGGCLIATATFSSELAPQVQQLRELRDNSLLQTSSGTSFINTFNDFYYSFSPTIADWERENPVFKEFVKITLTPMISSLSILNYVNMDSEESVLGYGISLIILNIGMYIGIPILGIVLARKKF